VSHRNPVTTDDASQIRQGIVIALDVTTIDRLHALVTATSGIPGVTGYKIGPELALEMGLGALLELLRDLTDLPLIYDHQKAGLDVPSNAPKFGEILARHGVNSAIVFPVGGPTIVDAFISGLTYYGVTPLVGGRLPVADYTVSSGGWIDDAILENIAAIAIKKGQSSLVVPLGTDVERVVSVAAAAGARPTLYVPGVRGQDGEFRQLASVAASVDGVFPIVGRAVITANDPAQAASTLVTSLAAALGNRPDEPPIIPSVHGGQR
jgi:orotidine-5'-phosphate decarboxylase